MNMNNTILLGLLCMISLYGCKEDSILRYDETLDSVYFEGTTPGEQTSVQEINFAERIVRNDDIVLAGDSVNTLTIKLILRVMGWEADHDRKVSLNVRPAVPEDSRTLANHEISGPANLHMKLPAIIRQGRLRDTLVVTVERPSQRQAYYASVIEITAEQSTHEFLQGPEEGLKQVFIVTDHYEKPSYWGSLLDYYYGEYSPEKHAFMVTVLKMTNFDNTRIVRENKQKLHEALERYNKEYPNAPKDFTFPK